MARGTMTERQPGVWRLRVVAGYGSRSGKVKVARLTTEQLANAYADWLPAGLSPASVH